MKVLEFAAKIANKILMVLVIIFSLILFMFSVYVLYDVFYTEKNAFISYDLLQYRPEINSTDPDGKPDFEDLIRLNPDTVGWLEIYDTNICYPIVQGRDDLEYAGKDIYGYNSLTGSIYLSSENQSAFNDWYNLIYGHHMDNGAMFGDIEKYRDKNYFYSHQKGILQTINGNYELTITACVLTNSYEDVIYTVGSKEESNYGELHEYIREHSVLLDEASDIPELGDSTKILAFSTCEGASTNGRLVLFAEAEKADGPITKPETKRAEKPMLQVIGRLSNESHWAFLNLICVLLTFLIMLPLFFLRIKYRQLRYAKHTSADLDDILDEQKAQLTDDENERFGDYSRMLKRFRNKIRIGILAEFLLTAAAVIIFLLTENLTKPMVIRDRWTWLMLLIAYTALLADFLCFRYRGRRVTQPDQERIDQLKAN